MEKTIPNHAVRENAHNDELYSDLRYQGQIEDRESGLYYNVNRYYDADSGQYLSPDPIGFAGGLRPQAYVFNPLGLAGCCGKKRPDAPKKIKLNRASVTHVKERHVGNKNPRREDKSKWTVSSAEWKSTARDTFRNPDRIVEENGRFLYEKTYKNPVGLDPNGGGLYKTRVVTESSGNLVTVFPQSEFKVLKHSSRILLGE